MKNVRNRMMLPVFAAVLGLGVMLPGCTGEGTFTQGSAAGQTAEMPESKSAERSGTFFDTVIGIRINDPDAEELMDGCFRICEKMENTLSAQKKGSELYRLNHRKEQKVTVSEDLADCIRQGLFFSELSEGAFDITILPVKDLWDFETEDHEAAVPKDEDIQRERKRVDYRRVSVKGNEVVFSSPDTRIDLGGIAKGYISGKLKEYLQGKGCTSAMINLGGNVSAIGKKTDGSPWIVGIQKPFSERGEILTTVQAADQAVISSGIYERYFRANGAFYHHIIDPQTGYPAKSDLNQVTIIGTDDTACDALATIGIVLGREKTEKLTGKLKTPVKVLFTGKKNELEWYPSS